MFLKSFSLFVTSVQLLAKAVAAIIASGVFILFSRRKITQFEITSSSIPRITLSVKNLFTFSSLIEFVFQDNSSIFVMTDKFGMASITSFIKFIPTTGNEFEK